MPKGQSLPLTLSVFYFRVKLSETKTEVVLLFRGQSQDQLFTTKCGTKTEVALFLRSISGPALYYKV